MLGPRLHLDLLMAGTIEVVYLQSVQRILDTACILAHQLNRPDLMPCLEAALNVIIQLTEKNRTLNGEEQATLRDGFNLAEAWIGLQTTVVLNRAMIGYDRRLASSTIHR